MKKPTKEEIQKAREQVQNLFIDSDWFEIMKHWDGDGWSRSDVMCGIIVGIQIAENRQKKKRNTTA